MKQEKENKHTFIQIDFQHKTLTIDADNAVGNIYIVLIISITVMVVSGFYFKRRKNK